MRTRAFSPHHLVLQPILARFAAGLAWLLLPALVVAGCSPPGEEQEHANPAEVIEKVRQAAALLEERGSSGLEVLRDPTSEFMWKDTYVFVVDCDADEVMANPAFPDRVGGDIKQHTDYAGKQYGLELCETAKRPGGGWLEYVWPRSGGGEPTRKTSYVVSVPGQPYQLGAGIYNETVSLEELERLTAEASD